MFTYTHAQHIPRAAGTHGRLPLPVLRQQVRNHSDASTHTNMYLSTWYTYIFKVALLNNAPIY